MLRINTLRPSRPVSSSECDFDLEIWKSHSDDERNISIKEKHIYMTLVQHEKAATFLDILKSFFRPTLVRV